MKLATRTLGDVDVIVIDTASLDADTAPDFRRAMEERLRPKARIVIDLAALTFIDSSGLGAVLTCLRRLHAAGGDLKLCNMRREVRAMFELVRMHRIIEIHESAEVAVESF